MEPAKSSFGIVCLLSLLALGVSLPVCADDSRSPGQIRQEADRFYTEKSYALALDDYRHLLPLLPTSSPERTVIAYRIAVTLGQSQHWDDALTAINQFLADHKREPLWQARGLYQRGLLLNLAPQQGYKVGAVIYRGGNYPHVTGSETPQYVNLQDDDQKSAVTDFEQALSDYESLPPAARPAVLAEEADMMFDLAKLLPLAQTWGSDDDWKAARTYDWRVDPMKPYDPSWPSPKKVLFLYARIPVVIPADRHRHVLAELGLGLYIAQSTNTWIRSEYRPPHGKPNDKDYWHGGAKIVQTIPYASLDPIAILDQAAAKNPDDPQAPQLRLIVAKWMQNGGDSVQALARYRALVARYPHCRWVDDANADIQEILARTINLDALGSQPVGAQAVINVYTKNLKSVTLNAYSVPLAKILNDPKVLNNPELETRNFSDVFGGARSAETLGPRVATWTYDTTDKSDYQPVSGTVKTPLTQVGAYVIEAESPDGTVRGATLVLISDLAVIRKTDKNTAIAFVTDARSGAPVANANVFIRQLYSDPHNGYDNATRREIFRVIVAKGQTDAQGVFTTPLSPKDNGYLARVEVFADAPGNRCALANDWGSFGYNSSNPDQIKGYVYTDRSVYRPAQSVYFRDILAKPAPGGSNYAPLVNQPVIVVITDSKGQDVYHKTLTTNAFGSIHDTLLLPKGAPLGEYNLSVQYFVSDDNALKSVDIYHPSGITPIVQDCGNTTFRVEEYKKPEFIVQVTPAKTQARFGETVTAKISARYYFGNPVVKGKVTYKIFRNEFYADYQFPQPYDWLYNSDRNGSYPNAEAANGELVTQGTAVTDADGEASVSFKADKGSRGYQGDYAYTVMADVTDSSRRLISGEGVLHVTNQQFYTFLNLPRSFAPQGDTVQVELRAIDADQKPVVATGTLTVYKLLFDETTGKETQQAVHTQTITTDADGKAFTTWTSQTSGQYQISFTARDKYNAVVRADTPLWIAGDDLDPRSYRVGGIILLTDKTTYEQGERAHLLIVAQQPDDWVLLTQESDDTILKRDLVHVTGRALTVDVPIVRAHVPNFALAAVAMRDYQFYQWNQELFVPPSRQLITMSVTGDKSEYKPGDTGVFHVKAVDYLGKPVASEISLAVTDAAVEYIQKDYAADIRMFYYGDRRYLNVQSASSQSATFGVAQESDAPEQSYQQHGFVMPDMGRLPSVTNGYGYSVSGYYRYYSDSWRYWGNRNLGAAYSIGGGIEMKTRSQPNGLYQFPGLVFGRPGAVPDPSGYTHIRGSDANSRFFAINTDAIVANTADNSLNNGLQAGGSAGKMPLVAARVRSNFADTAFWTPAIVTDPVTGEATLNVTFPDTLTTWKASARGATQAMQVGTDETHVVTTKHLLIRLESPRFFVERDQVTLSAIVMNTLKTAKQVRISLDTDAELLDAVDKVRTVTVAAGSEQRVDWTAHVKGAGTAKIIMTAQTDEESDAVRQSFPVLEYGVQKFIAGGGVLGDAETTQTFTVTIPHDHKSGSAALLVQVTPSLAATAMDALPYLADYPYGCIEQTLSRFVPTVLVAGALREAGIDLDTLHKRAVMLQTQAAQTSPLGQTAETTNDTDQTGYTYPHGTPNVLKTPMLAPELQYAYWYDNPVFDPDRLASMEQDGLSRLTSMQRGDGGFGWWPDSVDEDPYMTAYALYSLCAARDAGLTVPEGMVLRAAGYLETYVRRRDDQPDLAVWATYAVARAVPRSPIAIHIAQAMYQQRSKLSPYGAALLALTLHAQTREEQARVLCRNLVNTARIDPENGTASWQSPEAFWWYWYYDDVETTAWVLQALIAVDPKSDLSPMLVKWLVRHKQGTGWETTKATAFVVNTLTQYVRLTHELDPDYTLTVALGDRIKRTFTVNRENALFFDNAFLVPASLLTDGAQTVTITKTGQGRCYFASSLQYVTTEEQIKGAGTELKVQRRYYRLTPKLAKRKDWAGGTYNALDYDRAELRDGAVLKSGDMIEVELILDTKNDYDYVAFEDMKPAGCEPVDLRSGGRYGDGLCSDMELRDTKTAFFVDHLPQGTRVLRYRLRAEVPGAFHALPCNAYAMYAPGVRALSDSQRFTIVDAPASGG